MKLKLWITLFIVFITLNGLSSVAHATVIASQYDYSALSAVDASWIGYHLTVSSYTGNIGSFTVYGVFPKYNNTTGAGSWPYQANDVTIRVYTASSYSGAYTDCTFASDSAKANPYTGLRTFVPYSACSVSSGNSISVYLSEPSSLDDWQFYQSNSGSYFFELDSGSSYTPPITDVSTRFISVVPAASSTVSTSTATTIGGDVYVNPDGYVDGSTYVHISYNNQTASLGLGSALEAWNTAFGDFYLPITSSSTVLTVSTTTIFNLSLGKTYGTYQIVTRDCPWYGLGLFCSNTVLTSSTTYFYVGQKTGFDISQEAGNLGIFGLAPGSDAFLSTTTNAVLDCNIGISFDVTKCLYSFVVPNNYLASQILPNFESLPVLGWPIRFIAVLITTTATSSLPTISYTFATSNHFLSGVNLHFNPWPYMYQSGSFVKEAVADNGAGDVWDIMGPFVKLVVYLTLLFVIIRRLTGLNWGSDWNESESVNVSTTTDDRGKVSARTTHTFSKRRKL